VFNRSTLCITNDVTVRNLRAWGVKVDMKHSCVVFCYLGDVSTRCVTEVQVRRVRTVGFRRVEEGRESDKEECELHLKGLSADEAILPFFKSNPSRKPEKRRARIAQA
jgi:hypothetical protein